MVLAGSGTIIWDDKTEHLTFTLEKGLAFAHGVSSHWKIWIGKGSLKCTILSSEVELTLFAKYRINRCSAIYAHSQTYVMKREMARIRLESTRSKAFASCRLGLRVRLIYIYIYIHDQPEDTDGTYLDLGLV